MPPQTLIRFGVYEVDLEAGELLKDGIRLHIQDQPLRVLRVLLEHPGELVTREQLKQAIAPDSAFGDFDHALNVAVAKLRTALNDPADYPVYIETLHKRGYRLIAPLAGTQSITHGIFSAALVATQAPAATRMSQPPARLRWWWVVAAAFVLIGTAGVLLIRPRRSEPASYRVVAFTTMQGVASQPAFSPDGNEIAFVWRASTTLQPRIYVQTLGSVVARKLIDDADPDHVELAPRWFPDGRSLVYLRGKLGGPAEPTGIWTVSRTGGAPRKLLDNIAGFDVAPDGNTIVVAEVHPGLPRSLYEVDLNGTNHRQITHPAEDRPWGSNAGVPSGDWQPRYSPDGTQVAFGRLQANTAAIYVVAAQGGEAQRVSDELEVPGLSYPDYAWAADGRSLLVWAARRGSGSVPSWWRLWLHDKRWESVPLPAGSSLTVSRDGQRVAFAQSLANANIWRFDLAHPNEVGVNLTGDTSLNLSSRLSPDGRRLAFGSTRTGHSEIFVSDADGNNPVQLTNFHGKDAGSPRWSPDGKQIAFDYRPSERAQVFVIDSSGGSPRQMTFDDADNVVPQFSQDGRWLYFIRLRKGGSDLWKLPASGGTPIKVAPDVFRPEQADDGKTIYYIKLSDHHVAIYARTIDGGDERLIVEERQFLNTRIAVNSSGIYYQRFSGKSAEHQLMLFRFKSRRSELVMRLPFIQRLGMFAVSPDGRYYLLTKSEQQSNIMLVENFR